MFQGKLGNVIGRLPNGKIALIANRECNAKPLPGEEWECEVIHYNRSYAIVKPLKPTKLTEIVTLTFKSGKQSPIAHLPNGKVAILPVARRGKVKPGETYECAIAKILDRFAVVIPLRKVRIVEPVKPKNGVPSKAGILTEPIKLKVKDNVELEIPAGAEYLVGSTKYFKHGFAKFNHPILGVILVTKYPGRGFHITAPNLSLHHEPINFNPHPPNPISQLIETGKSHSFFGGRLVWLEK
jgi:hypothetical protein